MKNPTNEFTPADLEPGQEHRVHAAKPPATALERAIDSMGPMLRIYVLRQSDTNKRKALQTLKADLKVDAHLPDVACLRDEYALEDLVHGRGPGVFKVQLRHLPGGGSSTQHVGTLLSVGDTLVMIALSSAAEANLEAEHEEDRGNAFIETLRVAVRRASHQLWATDPRMSVNVRFGEISRLCRNQGHARKAVGTMAWAGSSISTRDHQDLAAGDDIVFDVLMSTAEANLKNTNRSLWKGKDGKLADGGWLGTPPPITHEYIEVTRTDRGRWTEVDTSTLAPTLTPAQMRDIVETVLRAAGDDPSRGPEGVSDGRVSGWATVARALAGRHGLQSRGAQDRFQGGISLAELDAPGASLRRALGPAYTKAWREGTYAWVTAIPKHGVVGALASNQEFVVIDGRKRLKTWLPCPLPELPCADECTLDGHRDTEGAHLRHSWGIPDWMWTRLDELVATPGRRGGGNLQRALSGGFVHWQRDQSQCCIRPIGSGHYGILERPVARAPQRTWKRTDPDTRIVVSLEGALVDKVVGEELEAVLRSLDLDPAPLSRPDSAAVSTEEATRRHAERTAELTEQVATAKRTVRRATRSHDAANEELLEAQTAGDDDIAELQLDVDHAAGKLTEATDQLASAQQVLDEHEAEEPESRGESGDDASLGVQLAHPAALAVLLQREAGGTLPRIVGHRLEEVLDPATHIDFDPLNQATVDVHLRFRLVTTSGEMVTADRKRTIVRKPNNNTSKSTAGAVATPDDVAKLLLRDGRAVDEAEERLDMAIGHGNSRTRGFALMRDFATRAGLSRVLLHPLIDAPPEVRQTVWLLHAGNQLALERHLKSIGADRPWAELIRQTYFRSDVSTRGNWPLTWLAANHAEDRLVIAALEQAGGSAHPDDLTVATGLPVELVKATAEVPAPSFQQNVSPKVSHPPAVLKDEWRGRPRTEQRLILASCPHDDCQGHVDTPLWTPETDRPADPARGIGTHQLAGLCAACRRSPHHQATFPLAYLNNWSVGHNRTGGQQAGTRTVQTATTEDSASRMRPLRTAKPAAA